MCCSSGQCLWHTGSADTERQGCAVKHIYVKQAKIQHTQVFGLHKADIINYMQLPGMLRLSVYNDHIQSVRGRFGKALKAYSNLSIMLTVHLILHKLGENTIGESSVSP